MVLEAAMSVRDAIKNPWHMLLFGILISVISFVVAYAVFPSNTGLVTIFVITIISSIFMWKLFMYEEWYEEHELKKIKNLSQRINPASIFSRYGRIFLIYSSFFIGIVVGLSFVFWLLPDEIAQNVFSEQIVQLERVNTIIRGAFIGGTFGQIFLNNVTVMSVSFIFALLFGIGAIFVISWNASVLSVFLVKKGLAAVNSFPHAIFELSGYFLAAIAGGIISAAIVRRGKKPIKQIATDMIIILVLAVAVIFLGAIIESAGPNLI